MAPERKPSHLLASNFGSYGFRVEVWEEKDQLYILFGDNEMKTCKWDKRYRRDEGGLVGESLLLSRLVLLNTLLALDAAVFPTR